MCNACASLLRCCSRHLNASAVLTGDDDLQWGKPQQKKCVLVVNGVWTQRAVCRGKMLARCTLDKNEQQRYGPEFDDMIHRSATGTLQFGMRQMRSQHTRLIVTRTTTRKRGWKVGLEGGRAPHLPKGATHPLDLASSFTNSLHSYTQNDFLPRYRLDSV